MKRRQNRHYSTSVRNLSVLILTLILSFSYCLTTCAAVSKKEAEKAAEKVVAASCRRTSAEHEKDEREWEFVYLSKTRKTKYEIHVDDTTGKVTEVEMEKVNRGCASCYRISRTCAKKAVLKIMKGSKITGVKKKRSGCRCTYRVTFRSETYRGYAVVNAGTGKVIAWEKKYKTAV